MNTVTQRNIIDTVPADICDKVMPERLKKQTNRVRRVNAVVLFEVSGPDGGQWTLNFKKTSDWIARGRTAVPRIVLRMSDETFMRIYRRQLSPKFTAMLGRVKLEPMDFGIANKLLFLLE
jgi:putative sterol carrier protein